MPRRAILFGSNGTSSYRKRLRFARKDVTLLANHLSSWRCGFEVSIVPARCAILDVQRLIFEEAEKCSPEDFFLVYFYGMASRPMGI